MRFLLIFHSPFRTLSLGLLASISGVLGTASPGSTAEQVRLQFHQFSREVSISSLAKFSRSGEVDPTLRSTLRYLKPAAQQRLRAALSRSIPLTPSTAAKFLSTDLGKSALKQLAKVMAQPPEIAEPALSSALILGAAKVNALSFIDVLETYPTPLVPINVAALLSLGKELKQQFNLQNTLFTQLSQMLGQPSNGPALDKLAIPGDETFTETPFQFKGSESLMITAVAYLPNSATPKSPSPLIVIAPGLDTDMNVLLYAGKNLASHGYAVAALDFPFTSKTAVKAVIKGTSKIPAPNSWYLQPISVSELINEVELRWGKRVNSDQVGAIGQSLGGYTVMALAGAELDWDHLVNSCKPMDDPNHVVLDPAVVWQCDAPSQVVENKSFRDPRVKAVLAINPVTNPIFSPATLKKVNIPILMISGSNDIIAPPISQQIIPFTSLVNSDSRLVLQNKGTHLSFLNGRGKFPKFILGPDRPLARLELKGLAKAWFNQHLRSGADQFSSKSSLMGSTPLKLLMLSTFSLEQLKNAEQGLREFP